VSKLREAQIVKITVRKERRKRKDERFSMYRKKNVQPMRPYIPGEDLSNVSVNVEDTPEEGGMIAVNPANEQDRWYVAKKFFLDNYVRA